MLNYPVSLMITGRLNQTDSVVTNICIKQIMHSFCVYNQSLLGSTNFQLCLMSLRYGFHVVRWGFVRDWTLFRKKTGFVSS